MPPLERILCIEDEADIQEVIQVALEMVGGFQVKLCDTGEEALDQAAAFKADMILLDVMMSGMDGPATLRALRTQPETTAIPVIFITARARPAEVAEFMAMGVLAVIAKPFNPMTLAREIEILWQQQP